MRLVDSMTSSNTGTDPPTRPAAIERTSSLKTRRGPDGAQYLCVWFRRMLALSMHAGGTPKYAEAACLMPALSCLQQSVRKEGCACLPGSAPPGGLPSTQHHAPVFPP
jgi:hypothetical protein